MEIHKRWDAPAILLQTRRSSPALPEAVDQPLVTAGIRPQEPRSEYPFHLRSLPRIHLETESLAVVSFLRFGNNDFVLS
jgi:hypothetical protein